MNRKEREYFKKVKKAMDKNIARIIYQRPPRFRNRNYTKAVMITRYKVKCKLYMLQYPLLFQDKPSKRNIRRAINIIDGIKSCLISIDKFL